MKLQKDDKDIIERVLYPKIKASVIGQLDIHSPLFSVSHLSEADQRQTDKTDEGLEDCVYITDGKKYLCLPVKTPLLVNVSLLVDTNELKAYILE